MNENDVKTILARLSRRPIEDLSDDRSLRDVVVDSFDMVELVVDLQEESGVRLSQDDLRDVSTVGDLVRLFARAA